MENKSRIKISLNNWETPIFAAVVILSVLYYLLFEYNSLKFDDAFITYRYSLNLSAGNGFVYNPGEHVYGTSTPFYAAYLSVSALFFGGEYIHVFSQVSSLIFFNLIFLLIYCRYKINIFLLVLVYVILFFNVYVYNSVFSGMETIFVIFLMFVLIILSDKKVFYILVPLLVLTRLDVSFIFLVSYVFVLLLYLLKREISLRSFMNSLSMIILGVGFAFLVIYLLFGSLIPNTILAKNVIYKNSVFHQSLIFRFNQLRNFGYPAFVSVPVLFFVFIAMITSIIKSLVRERITIYVFVFTILYFLFEMLFITLINYWYIPVLSFMIMINLMFIAHELKRYLVIFCLLLVLGTMYNLYTGTRLDYGTFYDNKNNVFESELYKVAKSITPGSKIFCGDIGVIGFFCNGSYIYDYSGLVTPSAIEYNKIKMNYGDKGISTDYRELLKQIEIEKPEYVIFRDYPFYNNIKNDSVFILSYTLLFSGKYENMHKKR